VASVLDKLGLRNCTQIILYALKRGVVRIENLP
jgi:DNA-binding CsgD family transcriptional regulator